MKFWPHVLLVTSFQGIGNKFVASSLQGGRGDQAKRNNLEHFYKVNQRKHACALLEARIQWNHHGE